MDTKDNIKDTIGTAPTSAFTRYVRNPPPEEILKTQDDRKKRKSAFARIKQLFSLQSP